MRRTTSGLAPVLLPLALAMLLVGPRAAAAATPLSQTNVPRVAGHYSYIGGAAEIAGLDRAIDQVVSRMNFFVRGIARKRMRTPNLPTRDLRIVVSNGSVTVVRPGRPQVTTPGNGQPMPWTSPEGEHFMVSQRLGTGGMTQRFVGAGGVTDNVLRLSPDGRSLRIETRIRHKRLPSELHFTTSYRRM